MSTSDRWTFLGVLRAEHVEMYLDQNGNLRARGQVADAEVAGFIRAHRSQIIEELRRRNHG